MRKCWTSLLLWLPVLIGTAFSCGVVTHIEIAERASEYFKGSIGDIDIRQLLLAHQDAFQAGSTFPDSFYYDLCFQGKYHDISEDTHWGEFLNATLNYITRKYPPPWNKPTEKLVVFVLGIVSHQVADVLWHSLGIQQGFISTMAQVNYGGSYSTAHEDADIGGDILNAFELNLDYIHLVNEWYVPVEDLHQIYVEFYGQERISRETISTCTSLLLLARLGEVVASAKLYPYFANRSPFLVNELSSYFLGGLNDMAVWTSRIWSQIIYIIQHGTQSCHMPDNTLFLRCNKSEEVGRVKERRGTAWRYFKQPYMNTLNVQDVQMRRGHRGVYIKLPSKLKQYTVPRKRHVHKKNESEVKDSSSKPLQPDGVYTTKSAYSDLGRVLVSADVTGDGWEDLIVGAPGYSYPGNPQCGAVYIIYGGPSGIGDAHDDIANIANISIYGHHYGGRFGWSVAVVDLNTDGRPDLVVSAPAKGSDSLKYQGLVSVYYGQNASRPFLAKPDWNMMCAETYCNLGFTLDGTDVNGDGYKDLIIGSPFAPSGGTQRGQVALIFASKHLKDFTSDKRMESTADIILEGIQDYEWFGYSLKHAIVQNTSSLIIGAPNFRICHWRNCSFSAKDRNSAGRVYMYDVTAQRLDVLMTGQAQFAMLGTSLSLNPHSKLLAIGASSLTVEGQVGDIPVPVDQAGSMLLLYMPSKAAKVKTQYSGDRMFDRFGQVAQFSDVNGDGYLDFLVGAPLRTQDALEELSGAESGSLYVFLSTKSGFPAGNVTSNCDSKNIIPCPGYKANFEFSLDTQKARLGSSIAAVHAKNKTIIVCSASHSSLGGRISGSLFLYFLEKGKG